MNEALVASVGTTHPRNVAGVGRDARVAAEYGAAHAMAIAAVSAQDDRGVQAVFPIPPDVLLAQLRALDFAAVRATRAGALGTAENAAAAGDFLRSHTAAPVIFDPVMHASTGGSLYRGDALAAVRAFIARVPVLLTPNVGEAEQLTDVEIHSVEEMIAAGRVLVEHGASAALVKGGHLPGDPVVDVLVYAGGVETFVSPRLPLTMRGTGCTLAMALACELAQGRKLIDAVKGARAYVRANIARS